MVAIRAHKNAVPNMMMSCTHGKYMTGGLPTNAENCKTIVNAAIVPTITPRNELAITRMKAS